MIKTVCQEKFSNFRILEESSETYEQARILCNISLKLQQFCISDKDCESKIPDLKYQNIFKSYGKLLNTMQENMKKTKINHLLVEI